MLFTPDFETHNGNNGTVATLSCGIDHFIVIEISEHGGPLEIQLSEHQAEKLRDALTRQLEWRTKKK